MYLLMHAILNLHHVYNMVICEQYLGPDSLVI